MVAKQEGAVANKFLAGKTGAHGRILLCLCSGCFFGGGHGESRDEDDRALR